MTLYAARFVEERLLDDGVTIEQSQHLVVVEAESAAAAGEATGLVYEEWSPATEADIDEWDSLCDEPLTEGDLDFLMTMIAARQRVALKRRRKDRELGRWWGGSRPEFDANRRLARHLAVLAGKLEMVGGDE